MATTSAELQQGEVDEVGKGLIGGMRLWLCCHSGTTADLGFATGADLSVSFEDRGSANADDLSIASKDVSVATADLEHSCLLRSSYHKLLFTSLVSCFQLWQAGLLCVPYACAAMHHVPFLLHTALCPCSSAVLDKSNLASDLVGTRDRRKPLTIRALLSLLS